MQEETMTIHELIPAMKKGWVACDQDGDWKWFSHKPSIEIYKCSKEGYWSLDSYDYKDGIYPYSQLMDELPYFGLKKLLPFDGDWKESLIEIK